MESEAASRHVVLSGCSGGGKSTLLGELARRGFRTVPEPGRRIVERELRGAGKALPWVDLEAFARAAIAVASADRESVRGVSGWVFFDRGLVDAAVALEVAAGIPAPQTLERTAPYHPVVFLAPPWPEIFATDEERRHDFTAAASEYERLCRAYRDLGYETFLLPKAAVEARADFVLDHLP